MNIVILDAHTTNPGDLSWGPLEQLGELTIFPRTAPDQLAERIANAEAIILNKTVMNEEAFSAAPHLRYIGVLATGYNTIDMKAAERHGVTVCNAPSYGTQSVAQHVFALLLELSNQVIRHHESVQNGTWSRIPDWTYRLSPMIEWAGKTMGIIGLGAIGTQTAKIAQAFGMKVIAVNRSPREVGGVELVTLEELLQRSDVISLHCPLTQETAGMINEDSLNMMKSSAILINTGRGGLIEEEALLQALESGRILAAGLDVLSEEPPSSGNPLIGAPNCLITPHIAWGTMEARARLIRITIDNLRAFQLGTPMNVVS